MEPCSLCLCCGTCHNQNPVHLRNARLSKMPAEVCVCHQGASVSAPAAAAAATGGPEVAHVVDVEDEGV